MALAGWQATCAISSHWEAQHKLIQDARGNVNAPFASPSAAWISSSLAFQLKEGSKALHGLKLLRKKRFCCDRNTTNDCHTQTDLYTEIRNRHLLKIGYIMRLRLNRCQYLSSDVQPSADILKKEVAPCVVSSAINTWCKNGEI